MNFGNVLFNPNGRIGSRSFLRGVIILVAIMIVIYVAQVYLGPAGAVIGLLSLGAPYLYLCVYGKRLHDSGKSAWWFLLLFVIYIIGNTILQLVLTPILAPGAAELQSEMELLMEQGQFLEAMSEYGPAIARESLFANLVVLLVVNLVIALPVSRLSSDPGPNKFGPPEGQTLNDTF
ncbi:MAG: DUF805 domain-containing protein [Pseudomonadota bacterium]